ncbi:ABC transporter ATP-binding protein [Streptomyces sp. TRM 70361]|uniref:ABC transporter ATP-binding protein n=1 Tax=Streptomyces sp. TRM 70361 TaxID=3116553 RepID=UPI002E7C0489|nr:ABC transporter ATP-binding protein [Streptomyces sp. TRM 70361]MEE1938340.1 ABC transporter ATP-binding protein [Streptomyces sp. TRM 70361]
MAAAESSHIHAQDVWRRYGSGRKTFDAVRGVSFTVRPGELFALLGTNGAGKTSTVELLEGLAAPHRGSIRLFGGLDPVADRPRIRPRTGTMLQEGGFISHLTVRESVQMWAELTSRARPVDQALELAGLAHRHDVMVQNLSGGEKRRLDLAVATLSRPDLLFLDEPTAGMDAEGRRATWELIRRLRERGSTILLTTHYLEEAESLADHLAIMHRGTIAAAGTVARIVADHPSTLSFTLDDRWTARDLPVAGTEAEEHGGRVTITTGQLQKDATRLLTWAEEHDVVLERFTARPASLEEAFIRIAGRDEAPGAGEEDQ